VQAPANTTQVPGGINEVVGNTSSQQITYTLEDAESAVMQDAQADAGVNAQNLSFFYIRGDQVDSSGKAKHWIVGILQGNNSSMWAFDNTGVSSLTVPPGLPVPETIPSNILSPAEIMKIASSSPGAGSLTPNGTSLELRNGQYTVTESGTGQPGIVINAITGELITTHD